jgi:hypothetical protein
MAAGDRNVARSFFSSRREASAREWRGSKEASHSHPQTRMMRARRPGQRRGGGPPEPPPPPGVFAARRRGGLLPPTSGSKVLRGVGRHGEACGRCSRRWCRGGRSRRWAGPAMRMRIVEMERGGTKKSRGGGWDALVSLHRGVFWMRPRAGGRIRGMTGSAGGTRYGAAPRPPPAAMPSPAFVGVSPADQWGRGAGRKKLAPECW